MIPKIATYEPVARIDNGPRQTQWHAAILHTAVSNASDLFSYWNGSSPAGVGAHFYINEQGKVFCYLNSDRQTGHAWDANPWAIGIETWDGGKDPAPDWNPAQIGSIVTLLYQLGIPPQKLKEAASNGVGWHRQFTSWNKSGHTCPGDKRAKQVTNVIIPKLTAKGKEEDEVKIEDLIDLDAYDNDVSGHRDPKKSWDNPNNGKPENMRSKLADLIFLLLKEKSAP